MRKLFTRLLGFLLLSVVMLFTTGLYAQEVQSTVELYASSVDKCYSSTNSYSSVISVKDFIKMKSFSLTLNYDKSEFEFDAVANENPLLGGSVTATVVPDAVLGIVKFTWTNPTEVTIGDNAVTSLFEAKFKILNFPNNGADLLFDSALAWDKEKSTFYYVSDYGVGGSYQVETTNFFNGALNVPVSYPDITYTVTPATCAGSNATIQITSPVGSGMKYYFNGSTTASTTGIADALAPSTNTVFAVDANGCRSITKTIEVDAPSQLTVSGVTTENPLCYDGMGEIQFEISGGTGPYTYWVVPSLNWTTVDSDLNTKQVGDPVFTNYKFSNFQVLKPAGIYYVAVNDANGCLDLRDNANWRTVTITPITSAITFTAAPTAATCNGSSDGSILVSGVSGGTMGAGYTVSIDGIVWKPLVAGQYNFTGLVAKTYTVQVKDGNRCVVSKDIAVAQPTAIAFTSSYTDATCAGGLTGSISVTSVSGGTGSYTFVVAAGANAVMPASGWVAAPGTIGNLGANYYSLWVKDANGCVKAFANQDGSGNVYPIQAPGALSFTTNADNDAFVEVSCYNGDFTLSVTAAGGVAPYTYSFDGGVTYSATKTLALTNQLADNIIHVYVKDANNCTVDRSVKVDVPELLEITSFTDVLAPTCPGGTDGRATVNARGGIPPYSYSSDNVTWWTNKVLALPEGTTTVYVKDAKGCLASKTQTIDALILSAFNAAPTGLIECFGNTTTQGISITGLTWIAGRKIQYFVSNAASTVYTSGSVFVPASVNGVAPVAPIVSTKFGVGTYYVGARDEYGCVSAVKTVTFNQNPILQLVSVEKKDATCSGLFDGSLTINTLGGNGRPSYAIVNNPIAIGNLVASDFKPVETYTDPTVKKVGKQVVQALRGTYYVVLRDLCITDNSIFAGPFVVDGYKPITLDEVAHPVAKTDITCHDANDGTITVTGVKGGKPEYDGAGLYTYKLYTAGDVLKATNTVGAFTNLTEGTYYVTITDATNCPLYKTKNITIVNPTTLTITKVDVTHSTCANSNDGIVVITADGGTGKYWLAVNASANGLGTDIKASDWIAFPTTSPKSKSYVATTSGVHKFYVKDANGCLASPKAVTLLAPKVITPVVAVNTPVTCYGGNDGSVDINATGGFETTDPLFVHTFAYSLTSDFAVSNTDGIFTGLKKGTYTVYVKATNTPAPVGNYTYPMITCTYSLQFEVTEPLQYSYMGKVNKHVSCKGSNDGEFAVTVLSGGTPFAMPTGSEYDVQLTTTANPVIDPAKWVRTKSKVATFSNLSHAIYSVWIKDSKACLLPTGVEVLPVPVPADYVWHKVASFEITEPATYLTASVAWNNDVTCYGGNDGKFTVTAGGGVPPYKYAAKISTLPAHVFAPDPNSTEWQASNVFDHATAATWIVWVMDANGCIVGGEGAVNPVDEWRVQVRQPVQVTFNNPTSLDVLCFGGATGKVMVGGIVSDAGAPYTFNISGVDAAGNAVNLNYSSLTAVGGVYTLANVPATETKHVEPAKPHVHNAYTVKVTDKNGCYNTKTVVVWQNTALDVKIVKADGAFLCPGDNSGVIEAVATGGTGSYTYQLSNETGVITAWQSIPSFIVSVGHTWKVEAKDGNDCVDFDQQMINAPLGVTANISETTCFGDTKASVIVRATGDAGRTFFVRYRLNTDLAYTDWAPFISEKAISNLMFSNVTPTENFYYFQVKDSEGCQIEFTKSFVPTQHPLQVSALLANDNASASIAITGGISPYSYQIGTGEIVHLPANGSAFQVVKLQVPTTEVKVYDAHGCFETKTLEVAPVAVVAETEKESNMANKFEVELTFSRPVTVATGDIVGGTFIPGTGTEFVVAMTGADLATVKLELKNTIVDAAGNKFAGKIYEYVIGDNTAPTLASKTPTKEVVLTNNHPLFKMTFNEDVKLGEGGKLKVYKVGTTTSPFEIPVTAAMISGKEVTVTYTTAAGLDKNTEYYVTVDGSAITDVAGNKYAGISDPAAWTFKTGNAFATVIEDPAKVASFKVYPNPFTEYVDVANASELSKIVVTNIAGQVVKEVVNPSQRIQLNELRAGAYFISLYDNDDVIITTAKIIKR